tara:strand:+ start:5474 stop:6280 length:807 start_codon:yes stop_codon:yes gene_type:complete
MSKELAEKTAKNIVISNNDLEEYSMVSSGFEETTADDLAIPFIRLLSQLSPQLNKQDGKYLENAEAGDFFNTVLNESYNGTEGISVVPCHYNRRYVEWKLRENGGGYVGSYMPDDPVAKTTTVDTAGRDILPNGNQLQNTANFYVLMLHPTLGLQKALICMTSTQIKKAKKWLTTAQSLMAEGKNGMFVLPLCSSVYKMKSVPESNEKGNWYGFEITREKGLDLKSEQEVALFKQAIAFAQSVKAGEVVVRETEEETLVDNDDDDNIM